VDTKYKLLDPQADKEGVLQQDLYQMYTYARKYGCPDVVLLYPRGPGDQSHDVCFQIESEPLIRVFARTVDLCRDLRRDKAELRRELSENLRTGPYSRTASIGVT
jgi:5-methylcytosine-specific restriction endonuclease McrBC regulatory subunit McrC